MGAKHIMGMYGSSRGGNIMVSTIRWIPAIILACLWKPSKSGLENFLNGTGGSTAYQMWILRGMTTRPRLLTTYFHLFGRWETYQKSWRPWLANKSGGGGNYVATAAQSWAVLFVLLWFLRPLGGVFLPSKGAGGLGAAAPSGAVVAPAGAAGQLVEGISFLSPVGAPAFISPTPRETGQVLAGSIISTSTRVYFTGGLSSSGSGGRGSSVVTGGGGVLVGSIISTYTPSATFTLSPTVSPSVTVSPTDTPSPTIGATFPCSTDTPIPSETSTLIPTVIPSETSTLIPTPTPTVGLGVCYTPTSSVTVTLFVTVTDTLTPTPTFPVVVSDTATLEGSATQTPGVTETGTVAVPATDTPSATITPHSYP